MPKKILSSERNQASSKKVLICDDDQEILNVMKLILSQKGFNVHTVTEGRGLTKVISKFNPDLLLLDIWLKDTDGRRVIKVIKQQAKNKNLPIIVVSALNETRDIAQNSGANDYLAKPFEVKTLISKVRKFVN